MLVFGGTTEGRLAVEVCEQMDKPYYYSTKSGLQQVPLHHGIRLVGAMDAAQMKAFCQEKGIRLIIDAAHPFATVLHETIDGLGLPVIRLQRNFGAPKQGVIYCEDYDDAVARLTACPARRLLALSGANTIVKLKPYWAEHDTIFRVLDRDESREMAEREGLSAENLIYYKSDICHTKVLPSMDEEKALMREVDCDAVITKESGDNGGFDAKVDAALQLGMRVYVVKHPKLPDRWVYVNSKEELKARLGVGSFLIAASSSNCGKTTFTMGLLRALSKRGLKVQPYKCGPDYIDTMFHHLASARESVNLDTFMSSEEHVREVFVRYGTDADVRVVEGVMGLFDGYDKMKGSSAEIAMLLNIPVILLINAKSTAYSAAALIHGFKTFHPQVRVAGVVFNMVSSESHFKFLRDACEDAGVACLGYLKRNAELNIPGRHLGLTISERENMERFISLACEEVENHVEIDKILAL